MHKKYELTNETKEYYGRTLHRIRALRDFEYVKKDDLGGFIEKEDNLSHEGNCWIYDNAIVCDNAIVYNDAKICNNAIVYNDAKIYGNARVYDDAKVCVKAWIYSNAIVCCNAIVYGYARVYGDAKIGPEGYINSMDKYTVIGPIGSRNDYTTFYLDKDRNIWVLCGCFNDTIDKFKEEVIKVHKNNKYAKQYLAAIELAKIKLGDN